jgi:hypothetical protein
MFLTNSSFNRHGSPCTLVGKSGHSDRVFILGVGTSIDLVGRIANRRIHELKKLVSHSHQTPVLQYIYLLKLCVQSGPLFWHPLFESDNGIIPIHEPCEP